MTTPLLQVYDNVLGDPEDYRAWALAQPFETIVTADEHWHGMSVLRDDTLSRIVADRLAGAQTRLTFFRKSPRGQMEPNFIHSDEGMGQWTAILYLNPTPAEGDGTVFWRYKPDQSITGSARALDKDPSLWEPWHSVPAKLGRLLIFDSTHYHSRAIEENYGETDADARLIQVAFGAYAKPAAQGIREATVADLPALLEMGRAFRQQTVYARRIPENLDRMAALAERLAVTQDGTVLVLERDGRLVGMIGLALFDHHLSGERTAGEVFFWVDPAHRGHGVRLLRRAEAWAKAQGATTLQMVAPTPDVETLYRRMGYAQWEVAYVKEFTCQ